MAEFDIDVMRATESELHNIPLCDNRMTFYYDETGNCGKFKLIESGINDPMALTRDFILGGVAFDGEICPADIDALFAALRLKPDAAELKFRHISKRKTDFHDWFGLPRACTFIRWLYESDLYIHYALINNLYYAIVDMVDSLWESQPQFVFSEEWVLALKSALYDFCKENIEEVLAVFRKFDYPDIQPEDDYAFCKEFCELIQCCSDDSNPEGFMIECFRQMFKAAGKHNQLSLLHDNEAGILVDQYYTLYLSRCYLYKNAMHHFDDERIIEHLLNSTSLISNGQPFKNYDFCASHSNPLTQISDAFVGIISRVFEYLDATSADEIRVLDRNQYMNEFENMAMLWELIERADGKHPMLIQNANDKRLVQERMYKLQLFASRKEM